MLEIYWSVIRENELV